MMSLDRYLIISKWMEAKKDSLDLWVQPNCFRFGISNTLQSCLKLRGVVIHLKNVVAFCLIIKLVIESYMIPMYITRDSQTSVRRRALV